MSEAPRGVVLVTGGAGFIGTNLVDRLIAEGRRVRILDDLSRRGVERNLAGLRARHGEALEVVVADIADGAALAAALADVTHVVHLAAQVAVTTSLVDPAADFRVNALGTLRLLEAIRVMPAPPSLLYTSTNKVYGALDDLALAEGAHRYAPHGGDPRAEGIAEHCPLSFHSPYGCSKGTADQYVLDYARSFGLRAAVFRMSCIYGPHQCGNEDQGWVAHFVIRAIAGRPVTIYGDGKQVRDILWVEDLIEAMLAAERRINDIAGTAFNIGGGPENTTSLRELLGMLQELRGQRVAVEEGDWRVGDQRWYVSDWRRFGAMTGWRPRIGVADGVGRLHRWLLNDVMAEAMARVRPAEARTRSARRDPAELPAEREAAR